jgi:hypothetical protein
MPIHNKVSGPSAALNGHPQGTMQPDATDRPSRTRIKHYIGLYDGAGITVFQSVGRNHTIGGPVGAHLSDDALTMVWSVALAKAIPRSDAWLHEPKLDGYRFQVVKDGRALRLYSKSGSDWTNQRLCVCGVGRTDANQLAWTGETVWLNGCSSLLAAPSQGACIGPGSARP